MEKFASFHLSFGDDYHDLYLLILHLLYHSFSLFFWNYLTLLLFPLHLWFYHFLQRISHNPNHNSLRVPSLLSLMSDLLPIYFRKRNQTNLRYSGHSDHHLLSQTNGRWSNPLLETISLCLIPRIHNRYPRSLCASHREKLALNLFWLTLLSWGGSKSKGTRNELLWEGQFIKPEIELLLTNKHNKSQKRILTENISCWNRSMCYLIPSRSYYWMKLTNASSIMLVSQVLLLSTTTSSVSRSASTRNLDRLVRLAGSVTQNGSLFRYK